MCCCALLAHSAAAQTVTGRVVGDDGRPLPYTNVVALSLPDSAFVDGVMTRDDGTFTLDTKGEGRLLRFSSLGYKTLYADRRSDMGTVSMASVAQVLGEIVVKSDLPKTRLKGEGMITDVGGTILEHVGTMERLLELGALPVVNENDSVAVEEIVYGDNDSLSAIVAKLIRADALIILTDTDGLYDADPTENEDARLIPEVREITDELLHVAGGRGSRFSTGGMVTKLHAAAIATAAGIDVIVMNGASPEAIYKALDGKQVGTFFVGKKES